MDYTGLTLEEYSNLTLDNYKGLPLEGSGEISASASNTLHLSDSVKKWQPNIEQQFNLSQEISSNFNTVKQVLSLTQSVTKKKIVTITITQGINLTDALFRIKSASASNTFNTSQEVVAQNSVIRTSMILSHSVDLKVSYNLSITENLNLGQNDEGIRVKIAEALLSLTDRANRAYIERMIQTINISHKLEQIHYGNQFLSLTDSISYRQIRNAHNNLSLTHDVNPSGSTFNRVIDPTVLLQDFVTGFRADDSGRHASDEDCNDPVCTRTSVLFEYGTTTLTLRPPQNQVEVFVNNSADNRTRGGEQYQYPFPNFLQLQLEFKAITRAQRDAFEAFLKLTAGLEMYYTDACNDRWLGCIITNPIDIEQNGSGYECPEGDGAYDFKFTFEGVKV